MKLFLILFLVAVTVVAVVAKSVKYDLLALKKCKKDGPWSIHGWWPEYTPTTWPKWCDPTKYHEFNYTAIENFELELAKEWYACSNWSTTNYELWRHEWEKHGTCTNDTAAKYFKQGLGAFYVAEYHNWYECCGDKKMQCLIPFQVGTTRWSRWCDHSVENPRR